MMRNIFMLSVVFVTIVATSFILRKQQWNTDSKVSEVLKSLGEKVPAHAIKKVDSSLVNKGEELFKMGFTTDANGKNTGRISRHYVCTSCHNNVNEDPVLSDPNPTDRLAYAKKNHLPYLQGTTLYGTVNRASWYNDDYEKKYGSLVAPARDTLENAVQLCAEVCSQGRKLTQWELEAMMQYLWSIELHIGDLNLSDEELSKVEAGGNEAVTLIKSKIAPKSPATFIEAIPVSERKYGAEGDVGNGEVIYTQACMHCHSPKAGITHLKLENNKLSTQQLANSLDKTSDMSVYQIVRKGTYPYAGYKAYMPHFTEERLSNQQLEDLVAYIKSKCTN